MFVPSLKKIGLTKICLTINIKKAEIILTKLKKKSRKKGDLYRLKFM